MRKLSCLLLMLLLVGCGSTIKSQKIRNDVKLTDFKKICMMIETAGGSVSVTNTGMGNAVAGVNTTPNSATAGAFGSSLSVSHAMSGQDQIVMAAQDISFALRNFGFETVDDPSNADIVALFSIGTVRYDPLVGWIADRAFLSFKDAKTKSIIYSIKADGAFITPTVNNLVENIIDDIEKNI